MPTATTSLYLFFPFCFFTCVKFVAFRDNWALFFLCNSFPPWTHAFGNHPLRFTLPDLLWRIWEVRWRFNSAALKYCLHSGRVEALSLTLILSRRVSKKLQKNKASTRRLLCLEEKKNFLHISDIDIKIETLINASII